MAAAIRADVGRDAPSRRTLRRHGVPRADMESAPTTGGKAHDQPGNHGPCMIANLCRGTMLASSRDVFGGAGFAGGPWPSPTNRGKRSAKREGGGHPGGRRAGCPHPAGPCGGRGVPRADMESAPTTGGKAHDQPGNHGPCMIANPCRGRCLHHPGGLVAARGPAGGINPAPTNKFYVLGQPEWRRPSGRT